MDSGEQTSTITLTLYSFLLGPLRIVWAWYCMRLGSFYLLLSSLVAFVLILSFDRPLVELHARRYAIASFSSFRAVPTTPTSSPNSKHFDCLIMSSMPTTDATKRITMLPSVDLILLPPIFIKVSR